MSVAHRSAFPRGALSLLLLAALLPTTRAQAQELVPGLTGAALGLVAGAVVSAGIITLQARRGEYVYSPEDALKWESVAIPAGVAAGLLIGLGDDARARHALIGGAAGLVVGGGVGALLGAVGWDRPEGPWAGGVIGAAAGVAAGALVGLLLPRSDGARGDAPAAARLELRVPVP